MTYYINNQKTDLHFWADQLRLALMDYFADFSGKRYSIEEFVKVYNELLEGKTKTYKGVAFSVEA
jgi:hypothetical protein